MSFSLHQFAVAQTPSNEFRTEHLTVEQGLSQTSVWSIIQDRRGFIWIGTADGLNKYDGYSFQIFRHNPADSNSLSNNTVWSLCEDRNATIWVGTVGGVHRFDPHTGKFSRLANDEKYKGTYLETLTTNILEDREGALWFATMKGIATLNPTNGVLRQFSSDEIPPLHSSPIFRVLHEDAQGDVWIANGEHLFRYERSSRKITRVPVGPVDEKIAFGRSVRTRDGLYWFATYFHGLWSYDPNSGAWNSYRHDSRNPASLADDRLRALCEDNEGRIWTGTVFEGLSYLDRSTGTFHTYKPSEVGGKNARFEGVSTLLRDRSGLLWVGYDGAGLVKLNPYRNKFHHVLLPRSDAQASGDNFFKSLIVDRRGDVWLGMYDQGLSVLNRTTGNVQRYRHSPTEAHSLCNNTVISLYEDKAGNVWIGTTGGLDEYDRRSNRLRHHDLSGFATNDKRWNVVNWLCEDSSGTLWCGTSTHLLKFDRSSNQFANIITVAEVFPSPVSPAVTVVTPARDGTLWVGTLGGGMLKLRVDGSIERKFVHEGKLLNSLSNNSVKTILVDDSSDVLWIGTEEGLNRYDPIRDRWRVYRAADGLPNDFIYGVLMDDHRRLWMSTNKGLSCMDTRDEDNPQFRNYTPDDGLQSFEFNTNVYFKATSGEMFFGGVNGFNAFFPDAVSDNQHVPSVVITGFKKFDQPFNLGGDVGLKNNVELKYSESVFSFEFAALEFTNSQRNQYAYRMEGFDKDWIYCGARREARYTNLDPGAYVFHVKGSNNDGVWAEPGTSIRVVIVPPFWRTGWFIVLMSALGVGAIGGTVRYVSTKKLRKHIERLEREKEIQDERLKTRERIARDLHDDLASTVGSASFFIESVKRTLKDAPMQAREFLDKTSSLLSEAEESMSDIVWSVSPLHDTLESLLSRIRLTTSDICKANRIKYEVNFPNGITKHKLADEVRRGIYLIFKESLANAARHANATMIRVEARIAGDEFELQVADNGKGMSTSEKPEGATKRGHGLRNMKKRAEEIGGELSIESLVGKGTTVVLRRTLT